MEKRNQYLKVKRCIQFRERVIKVFYIKFPCLSTKLSIPENECGQEMEKGKKEKGEMSSAAQLTRSKFMMDWRV